MPLWLVYARARTCVNKVVTAHVLLWVFAFLFGLCLSLLMYIMFANPFCRPTRCPRMICECPACNYTNTPDSCGFACLLNSAINTLARVRISFDG